MKKIFLPFLISIFVSTQFVLPSLIWASSTRQISNATKLEQVNIIKEGRKLDLAQTISPDEYNNDRFVVFIKKQNADSTKKSISSLGGVFSYSDKSVYGKAVAVPLDLSYMNSSKKLQFLNNVNKNNNVLAISPIQKRTLTSVPAFDDPLYPNDLTYSDSKQWYLSQPSGSNYGIDANRAWSYLDSLGKPYGGSDEVLVAVLDTGAAYETYAKYDAFPLMTSPDVWALSKGPDFTINLYSNSGETAENQLDDDNNNDGDFCMDKNLNGDCDAGERTSFFDDKNGVNIVDWGKYWSRVTYTELTTSPVCGNLPGVVCIPHTSADTNCATSSLANYYYYGCWESDMGHPNDVNGHGTFVSNIITSKANNGTSGLGVASGVSYLPIKIFGEYFDSGVDRNEWVYDSAYGDQIASAINYAVDRGADIINMSFAGDSIDLYEKMAMDRAYYEDGVLLIASSGNNATTTTYYPAGYESVMSVGASNKTATRATYSNYGSTLDLVAPVGSGVVTEGLWDMLNNKSITAQCSWDTSYSCMNVDPMDSPSPFNVNNYTTLSSSGTSFATPQVVGVAALIKTAYPNLSASDIRYILQMSSLPNGSLTYNSSIGHGVVNAFNAVKAVDYRGKSLDKIDRIYQSAVNSSGYLQTRYSDEFGSSWSSWITSGNLKSHGYAKIFKVPTTPDTVVQIMKATNNGIYTRYAEDNGYLANDDSQWSSWTLHGLTLGSYSSIVSGNNIVIAWKGTDGKTYTRYSSNGVNWNAPATSNKSPVGGIVMVYDSGNNKLLQLVRANGYYVYQRSSSDNGATWSGWIQSFDIGATDPSVVFANYKIFRTTRVSGNYIVTRVSSDGGVTWTNRTRSYGTSGTTKSTVSIFASPETNTVVQSYRAIDNKIYTRYTNNDGVTWSVPTIGVDFKNKVYALTTAYSVNASGTIIQFAKGSDTYLYYRRSTNGGVTWGAWRNTGSIKTLGGISLSYDSNIDRVLVSALYLNGIAYTRMSDDRGATFTSWLSTISTPSGISSTIIQIKDLDLSN